MSGHSAGVGQGKIRRAVERRILFGAAVVALLCVLAADRAWLAGCGVAVLVGAFSAWCLGWRKGVMLALVGLVAASVLHARKAAWMKDRDALLEAGEAHVTARVREDGRGHKAAWSAQAVILEGPAPGAKVTWLGRGEPPVAGSLVSATGRISPPEAARNPGEFDRADWMERMGMAAELDARRAVDAHLETPGHAALAARFRHGFLTAILHGLDADSQAAQVISAMVVGQRPADAEETLTAFRNSGTLHVFSVSGLHVAMVGGIGWFCLGWCGVSRRHAVMVLLPLMFGYAWITGNGPPAVRSAWMAALFLGAFVFRRKPDLLNSLGAVLLVGLLWDGRLLFQTGVQLSYGVVAAIAVGMGPASRLFTWISEKQLYLPDRERSRLRKRWDDARARLATSLSVSLAAAVGSTPLTMWHFGLVTPISLLANLVLLPLVFGILALGLLGAALFPIAPWATTWVNRGNALPAQASVVAAELFAAVPGGHLVTRRPDGPMLLIHDLPYGASSATLTDERGRAVMFDCGGRGSYRRTVLPSLRALGIEPHTILFSHPDGAHMGGGDPVWRTLPIRTAVLPVTESRSAAVRAWQSAAADGVHIRTAADLYTMHGPDGAVWHRLNTPHAGTSHALADDRVAVWRLDWRGWRILFTSDAGFRTEQDLLVAGVDLRADVVVAGKHRNDLPLGDDFLTAIRPQVIVAKNPEYPREQSIAPESVATWRERGITFVDQARVGAVTVTVDAAGRLVLSGFLTPDAPVVLDRK